VGPWGGHGQRTWGGQPCPGRDGCARVNDGGACDSPCSPRDPLVPLSGVSSCIILTPQALIPSEREASRRITLSCHVTPPLLLLFDCTAFVRAQLQGLHRQRGGWLDDHSEDHPRGASRRSADDLLRACGPPCRWTAKLALLPARLRVRLPTVHGGGGRRDTAPRTGVRRPITWRVVCGVCFSVQRRGTPARYGYGDRCGNRCSVKAVCTWVVRLYGIR
jgi:hypothetical protein